MCPALPRHRARAGAIRDQLAAVGIEITDTPSGARWALVRRSPTHPSSLNSKD